MGQVWKVPVDWLPWLALGLAFPAFLLVYLLANLMPCFTRPSGIAGAQLAECDLKKGQRSVTQADRAPRPVLGQSRRSGHGGRFIGSEPQ